MVMTHAQTSRSKVSWLKRLSENGESDLTESISLLANVVAKKVQEQNAKNSVNKTTGCCRGTARRFVLLEKCQSTLGYIYMTVNHDTLAVYLSMCVCLLDTTVSPQKGWTDRDAVRVVDLSGTKEPRIRWGPGAPQGKGLAVILKSKKSRYLQTQNGSLKRIGRPPSCIFKIKFLTAGALRRRSTASCQIFWRSVILL